MRKLLLIVIAWMSLFSSHAFADPQQLNISTLPPNPPGILWWDGSPANAQFEDMGEAIQAQVTAYNYGAQTTGWCANCYLTNLAWDGVHDYILTCYTPVNRISGYCGAVAPIFAKGYYLKSPYTPDPHGDCNKTKQGCATTGEPIEVGTGNMFLRETDFVSADKRLQFSRVYNSNSSYGGISSSVGHGWQGELDARQILTMDLYPAITAAGYFEVSSIYTTANDACLLGWTAIVAGGPSGKANPKWRGVTATYDGAGNCNLSNGQSVPVLSNDPSAGIAYFPDAQRGVTLRRGDGSQYFFFCSQGVCHPQGSNAKFTVTLDTTGYTILDDDGDSEHYDYLGFLSTKTYKDGYQQSFVYNNDNNGVGYLSAGFGTPVSITDNRGRAIIFGYDPNSGMLSTVSTPDGSIIHYSQDPQGRLTSVTYPTNPTGTRTYKYDPTPDTYNTNLLTGLVDENTNTLTTWTYDSYGRATSSTNAGSTGQASLTYNSDGTTTVKDALNTQRTYTFQNTFGFPQVLSISGPFCASCGAGAATTYDGNGLFTSSTDWNGNTTGYIFDAASGLPKTIFEAQNSTTLNRTTTLNWDYTLHNLLDETVQDAKSALVAKVDWQYVSGEPVARCEEDPTVTGATGYTCLNTGTVPAGVRRWTYAYCTVTDTTQCPLVGLLLSVTDPLGHATTYKYYMAGTSTCTASSANHAGDLCTITNALGQVTTILSRDGAGRPLAVIDANNVETDLQYNARGWLTQTAVRATNGTSGSGDQITGFGYDNAGNLTKITRPDSSYFVLKYDQAHRLTDLTDNLGNTIHCTLDAAGNRTREDTYDPSGGNPKRSVVRQFNALGELAKTINADGTTANGIYHYDPNGNFKVLTDGRGTVTNNWFDALNRMYLVDQDPGTTAPHVNANTRLTFDALDRVTNVNDPHGLNTKYLYDGLNDLTQLTSPDTGITKATYDAAGNVQTRTDPRGTNGTTAIYTYDALNRVTSITYPTTALNVTYTYDTTQTGCNQTTQVYGKGHLTYIKDGSGFTMLCYDRFGRMAHKYQHLANGNLSFATSYTFNLANHLTQETTPSGTIIKYTRDGIGRVTKVTYRLSGQTTDTPVVNAVTYYPFGPVASITYNDGRVLNRTYDQDYVIQSIADTTGLTGGLKLTFGRDVMGNLTQVNSGTGGAITGNKLVYDALNRLTNVNDLSSNPVWTYTYDATGNRLSKQAGTATPVGYAYPVTAPVSHQLQAVGSVGRGYDAMGDTTSIGTNALSFLYNDTGRMSQVNTGAANTPVMQYATNALGQRVEKYLASNTALTQYSVDDESGHALGDYDSNAARIRETIWMDGMPVGVLKGTGTATTLAYIEPDQLGTPRLAIDGTSNATVWNWSPINDPFGETQPTGSLNLNLRMPGQVFDAESGLNYNYFRDYDPTVGRYVESDPIGLLGGTSTFLYVSGSPLNHADLFGLWSVEISGFVGIGGSIRITGSSWNPFSWDSVGGRFGLGIGGGADFDPLGGKTDKNAPPDSDSIGIHAEAHLRLGPVGVGPEWDSGVTQSCAYGNGGPRYSSYGDPPTPGLPTDPREARDALHDLTHNHHVGIGGDASVTINLEHNF